MVERVAKSRVSNRSDSKIKSRIHVPKKSGILSGIVHFLLQRRCQVIGKIQIFKCHLVIGLVNFWLQSFFRDIHEDKSVHEGLIIHEGKIVHERKIFT